MKNLVLIISILFFQYTNAQLDPNGVLILNSGTTNQINAISPDTGALVYNIITKKIYVYDGANWVLATGASENWTKSGNDQYSAVSGNVGIGTTNPNYKLDIATINSSRIRLRGGASGYTNAAVILEATESTNYRGLGIFMHDDNANNEWYIGRPYANSDKFVINRQTGVNGHQESTSDDGTNNLFTMLNSGNVGIGTATPTTKLDIKGNLRVNTNSTYSSINIGPETNDRIFSDDTNDNHYGGGLWLRVHDDTAPNQYRDVMMLTESGNVGIGVLKPTHKLEVAGQVKITGGSPGAGKILTSDATGLATWQAPSSTTNNSILIEGKNQSMFGSNPNNGSCVVSNGIATFFTHTTDNNYMHIKLPYRIDTHNEMYHIKATGYRYGAGKVIDITWVGYCYKDGSALLSTSNTNSGDPEFEITQYVGSDNHIYLRFRGTTGSNYYQSFRIDSMNVGNGSTLTEGDIQIISSASANL